MEHNDTLNIGGREFHSRFILGSGKYSLELIEAAVEQAGAQMVTLAVRRANLGGDGQYPRLHPQRGNPAAQHLGRP